MNRAPYPELRSRVRTTGLAFQRGFGLARWMSSIVTLSVLAALLMQMLKQGTS